MQMTSLRHRALALVVGITVLAFSGLASADPPSRAARLGYVSGAVSFSPAGEDDWMQATLNRPLTTGDRLWADSGARAEIQIGGAMVRMSSGTSVSVLNLDDQITQLQLTQGVLNVRVLRLERGQMFEVDTPNVAFTLRQPGEYRIDVDPEGRATTIIVRKGQGEVYGEDAAFVIDARQPYRFMGTGMREYQHAAMPQPDDFDRWSRARDLRYDNSGSARYVSPDVVGYQDLDANGTWRVDATYGNVWFPNRVAAGWVPYSDGHWAWIDPWGWTWVDDAPWGYAVSHYGRWANLQGTWGWVPGPVRTRAYYAPALVVFIGGANFQLSISSGNVGGVGWFPLGPREVYQPAYPVSRRYYEDINRSNTVINNTVINNTYNNINVTNVYANQRVPGAVVAVPATTFVQSQPVSRAAVRVSREVMVKAPVTVVPTMAPTEKSVRGNAAQREKPPERVLERPVVARTAPPAAPVGFAAQQPQLTSKPGKPLDDAARKELKPAAVAPTVRVIEAKVAPPTTRLAPAPAPSDERGKSADRKSPTAAPVAVPKVASPAPAAQLPEQRERADQPGKGNQQRAPSPPTPAPSTPPQVAPAPKTASPAPVAQSPEQRERADQPSKGNQQRAPSPPVAAPAPQGSAPPTPKAALPPPVAQPPEQREGADQPGKGNQQRAPSPQVAAPAAPPAAPQVNVPPNPKSVPPTPVARPAEQRDRADQPGKGNQRAPSPPVAAPAPPPAAPQVKAAPAPKADPTAPPAQPPEQRGRADQPGKGSTPPVATPPPAPAVSPATVPPAPKAAPPAGQSTASKPTDMKKDTEKEKDKEKDKGEPKP